MNKLVLLLLVLVLVSCSTANTSTAPTASPVTQEAAMSISLSSTAFKAGASIPADYSCTGRSAVTAACMERPSFRNKILRPHYGRSGRARWNFCPLGDLQRSSFQPWAARGCPGKPHSWQMAPNKATMARAGLATPVPAHLPVRIVTSSNCMRWILSSVSPPEPVKTNCSKPCRDTSWHRVS